jgi:hypothetical protein
MSNYELHIQIEREAAQCGYPFGFACYGAYSPHHSFELNRGYCFWCHRHINDVASALSIPVPPKQ